MRSPARRLAVLLAVLGAMVGACVVEDAEQDTPVVAETAVSEAPTSAAGPSSGFEWPPPHVEVSRERAIQLAQQVCTKASPGAGNVENPQDPVARLMPFGEFEARTGSRYPSDDPADYVWVVQFEGESLDRFESTRYHYAGCAIDATRGVIRHEFRRQAEPLLLPNVMLSGLPSEADNVNRGKAVQAQGAVAFTREAAKELALAIYGGSAIGSSGTRAVKDRVEIELVRYTGTCHSRLAEVPAPTSTPGGAPQTPGPRRSSCGIEWGWEDSSNRLTWIVIVPVEMRLYPCGPERTPRSPTCWSQPVFALIDAETGEQYGGGGAGGISGPLVPNEELQALTRHAWAEGWWELWQRLRPYGGQPLPEGYAASLDRPDAPTPTPTPSPVVAPDATPTPTRTPAPLRPRNQTATPTSTVVPVLPTYPIPTPTPTPRPRLMALMIGILVDQDGCLAVVPERASDPVALIWTKEWHVVRRNGSNVTVVDTYDGKTTSVTWQLGQEVRLGGGTAGPLKGEPGFFTIGECPGPYWLVGDVR